MRPELPTGTVTFLFTDIEGSTRLLHALGPERYAEALAEHRQLLRHAFTAHEGVEVDTQGDAFFVAFPTAPGAAAAARDGQTALAAGPVRVRMGLHTGMPTVTAEGYVGVDVHRGARVAALAHGGQVLVTEATAALLASDERVVDLGHHRLKDFDAPVRLHQLGSAPFPPLRTPGTVVLPIPATPFLGRERELHEAVSIVLDSDPRMLSILGPGGTGKTRFALELARLVAEDADGGTLFVPLAALRDGALVLPTIADAVGADGHDVASIAGQIGDKRTHLLLDNLEQLLPEAAAPLAALAEATPALRIVLTSREALGISTETRFDLPPLTTDEAVAFFVQRAASVQADVEPSATLTTLCERLDRLPLALELGAARARLLSPEAMLERLSTRLDLPSLRDADPRHATLRATIAWSFDLLTPDERELFASLAVFRGSCTLEAAEEVCGADLETLASLIDKSLVRRRADASGADRYWMLETIREFAAAKRDELPEATLAALRTRHARRMLSVADSASLRSDLVPTTPRPDRLRPELDDVRAALDWAAGAEPVLAAQLVVALELHWVTQGLDEGLRRTRTLLDHGEALPAELRAELLTIQGGLTILLEGSQAAGEPSYRAAIDIFRELGDARGEAKLLTRLAVHAGTRGERDDARELLDRVRILTDGLDLPVLEGQRLGALAMLAEKEGDLERAVALYAESADVAAACGFTVWETWARTDLSNVALQLGRFELVTTESRAALAKAWEHGDRRIACWCLLMLARAALAGGDHELAGRLWGAVAAEHEEAGIFARDDDFVQLSAPLRETIVPAFVLAVGTGRTGGVGEAVSAGLGYTEP
jgi:predicted ATPase/class 3 adenylate cyclase